MLGIKMYRYLCHLFVCSLVISLGAAAHATPLSELFFSEYLEGTSNNKALEIFNGTGSEIDLGISGYRVQMFFNGSSSAGLTINLTGTVGSGDVFVLAHGSAAGSILGQADQTSGATWFNGDDAIVLLKGATVIDSIGQVGFDPGTEWGSGLPSTADNTLRRKASVFGGDSNLFDTFDPSVEWEGFAIDTFVDQGVHVVENQIPSLPPAVPEPGTVTLLGAGLAGLCLIRWRRNL